MNTFDLSVVIPTHNRKQMLQEMLVALSSQTLANSRFEVVVVDDGSSDGTSEMLSVLKTPYRLRSVYQANAGKASTVFSSGVSAARNRGSEMAEGRVLLFLDDDLLPSATLLGDHMRLHERHSDAVVLGRLLPGPGRKGKRGWNIWEERVYEDHYKRMGAGTRPPSGWRLYSANFSLSRELFFRVGGFDLNMGHIRGEDVELGLRLERNGASFRFGADAAAIHRGYRPFRSWCNSAYVLGPRNVVLARELGYKNVERQVFQSYRHKAAVIRLFVHLALCRPRVLGALARFSRGVSGALSFLRLDRLADLGYSLIYNLYHWQGVADHMGGREAFFAEVGQTVVDTQPVQRGTPSANTGSVAGGESQGH